MKFNHLILSMRKHVSSTGFFCVKYRKYELLSEVTKRPQLSPDPRQEPWSHTTSPDPLWGRAPAAGQQSATRREREGDSRLHGPRRWETCSGSGLGEEEKCLVSWKPWAGFRGMVKTIYFQRENQEFTHHYSHMAAPLGGGSVIQPNRVNGTDQWVSGVWTENRWKAKKRKQISESY